MSSNCSEVYSHLLKGRENYCRAVILHSRASPLSLVSGPVPANPVLFLPEYWRAFSLVRLSILLGALVMSVYSAGTCDGWRSGREPHDLKEVDVSSGRLGCNGYLGMRSASILPAYLTLPHTAGIMNVSPDTSPSARSQTRCPPATAHVHCTVTLEALCICEPVHAPW